MVSKENGSELYMSEVMQRLKYAGINENRPINLRNNSDEDALPSIGQRIQQILGVVNSSTRKLYSMLFFVMYDIASNKVRCQVAKYLLRQGCTRIQNSIYLADLSLDKYEQIRSDLTEVQAVYDNEDSILVVPISTDYHQAIRMIGKSIAVDIIMRTKNTLFF